MRFMHYQKVSQNVTLCDPCQNMTPYTHMLSNVTCFVFCSSLCLKCTLNQCKLHDRSRYTLCIIIKVHHLELLAKTNCCAHTYFRSLLFIFRLGSNLHNLFTCHSLLLEDLSNNGSLTIFKPMWQVTSFVFFYWVKQLFKCWQVSENLVLFLQFGHRFH